MREKNERRKVDRPEIDFDFNEFRLARLKKTLRESRFIKANEMKYGRLLITSVLVLLDIFVIFAVFPAVLVSEMIAYAKDCRMRRRVFSPPGRFAMRLLTFLFSKKAFDGVFAQAILDMRDEHAEALANGDLWKARWIVIRDHLGLCLTIGAYLVASVGKKLMGIWKMIP